MKCYKLDRPWNESEWEEYDRWNVTNCIDLRMNQFGKSKVGEMLQIV